MARSGAAKGAVLVALSDRRYSRSVAWKASLPPGPTTTLGLIYASLTNGNIQMVLNSPFMFEMPDGQNRANPLQFRGLNIWNAAP